MTTSAQLETSIEAATDENVTGGAHNSTLCAFRNPSVTWAVVQDTSVG